MQKERVERMAFLKLHSCKKEKAGGGRYKSCMLKATGILKPSQDSSRENKTSFFFFI